MDKKKFVFSLTIMLVCLLPVLGCETTSPDTQRGAIGGALVGAVAGGVIGHQMGSGLAGAAIGGTVGAVTGGVIGNQIDAKKRAEAQAQAAQAAAAAPGAEKLGISDIITLSHSGMSDDAIIAKIAETRSAYNLSVAEIEALRKQGVSTRVIDYMMNTTR